MSEVPGRACLAGKVVLVAGGGAGIGVGGAGRGGRAGGDVVGMGRGTAAAALLTGQAGSCAYLPGDVTVDSDWQRIIASLRDRWGRLDALVNSAGVSVLQTYEQMAVERAREMMRINVLGSVLGMKHAIPLMRASGGGCVVNIASVAALRRAPGNGAYAASKAAIARLSHLMNREYSVGKPAVRVDVVHPGLIWGDSVAAAFGSEGAEAIRAMVLAATPLGRVGSPEDISWIVEYLVSRGGVGSDSGMVIDGGLRFG